MKKYELMLLLSGQADEAAQTKIINKTTKLIEELKGKVEKIDKLGKKNLAYPIKKDSQAFYVLCKLMLDSTKTNSLEKKVRTEESILRYLLINRDA